VLWGGRDRLLKLAEAADHLGVSNATVYGLCERGELPYVWVATSMRIRPRDPRVRRREADDPREALSTQAEDTAGICADLKTRALRP